VTPAPAAPLVNPRVYRCRNPQCGFPLGVEDDDCLLLGSALLNRPTPLVCTRCRNLWRWRPGWEREEAGRPAQTP
jgi:hypothetical protein